MRTVEKKELMQEPNDRKLNSDYLRRLVSLDQTCLRQLLEQKEIKAVEQQLSLKYICKKVIVQMLPRELETQRITKALYDLTCITSSLKKSYLALEQINSWDKEACV